MNLVNKILLEGYDPDLNQFIIAINNIKSKYISLGCTLDISVRNFQAISIDMIKVPNKRQGVGSQIMSAITNECDKYGVVCSLSPVQDYGTPKAPLIKFYKKFGFVFNKGKNKDFRFMYTMLRQPKII